MTLRRVMIALLAAAVIAVPLAGTASAQAKEMFIPSLVYRTGPVRAERHPVRQRRSGTTSTMLNERDGGVNGVRIVVEECETQYDTKQGVECYERLKGKSGGRGGVQPAQHRDHLPAHPEGGAWTRSWCTRWATA